MLWEGAEDFLLISKLEIFICILSVWGNKLAKLFKSLLGQENHQQKIKQENVDLKSEVAALKNQLAI